MVISVKTEPVTTVRPGEAHSDVVDRLPASLRSCVHDYGYSVVHAFVTAGISRPSMIRHLINAVYLGAREPRNRRPAGAPLGKNVLSIMDDVLAVHGAPAVARPIIGTLRLSGMTVIDREPTREMIAASCAALSDGRSVSYEQKHRLRLRAALKRGDTDRWGWLDD